MWLLVKISIYHKFISFLVKKSFIEMKNFKLVTWYLNMVHIMWNDIIQYTFNFHKNYKLFKLFFEYICVFEYTSTQHLFPQIYSLISHFIKWNEIVSFLISYLGYILMSYAKILWKYFKSLRWGYTQTCTSFTSSVMWHPNRVTVVCFHLYGKRQGVERVNCEKKFLSLKVLIELLWCKWIS